MGQVFAEPGDAEGNAAVVATAARGGYEDCLRVTGTVRRRQSPNAKIPTGQVEVVATAIEVLNKAEPLPFHAHENAGEDIRLRYRYLDLRTPEMQRKMRIRTKLVGALRRWLAAPGFQEDRKSVVWGKGVSVRLNFGGPRIIKKKKKH